MSIVSRLHSLKPTIQTILNIVFNITSVITSAIISFFLTPYIVDKIGVEAHGFIGLATNIVSYISLGAIAINTVSSRFVAISYHSGDIDKARRLYTATFVGNILSVLLISFPAALVIFYIEALTNVPPFLAHDLKILLIFLLLNFVVTTLFNQWNIAPFIQNLLFITAFRDTLSHFFRAIILIVLFSLFYPRMYYVGLGSFFATCLATIYSGFFHFSLLPELYIVKYKGVFHDVLLLVKSGIWNVVNTGGVLLLNGLDLFLANSFLGAGEMGELSISKVVPTMLITLVGTLPTMFAPMLTRLYAKNDKKGMMRYINYANRLSSFVLGVPIYGFLMYSKSFYSLWMRGADSGLLSRLSFFSILPIALLGGVNSVYIIFTITNKLRTNALLVLLSGVLSTLGVLVALRFTSLGMYAILGIGMISIVGRQLFYAIPYSALAIGQPRNIFYREILYILKTGLITLVTSGVVKALVVPETWPKFMVSAILTGGISYFISFFSLFQKEERRKVLGLVSIKHKEREKYEE